MSLTARRVGSPCDDLDSRWVDEAADRGFAILASMSPKSRGCRVGNTDSLLRDPLRVGSKVVDVRVGTGNHFRQDGKSSILAVKP